MLAHVADDRDDIEHSENKHDKIRREFIDTMRDEIKQQLYHALSSKTILTDAMKTGF